jgi:hypothetical protein
MRSIFKGKITLQEIKKLIQKGSGNIYVIAILGTVVAGSALMVGGLVPQLDPPPDDAQAVQINTELEPNDRTNTALELRSFGILSPSPSPTPTLVPNTPSPSPSGTPTPTTQLCFDKAAVAIVVDVSGSMDTNDAGTTVSRLDRLKDALRNFLTFFKPDSQVSLIAFSGNANVLVPMDKLSSNRTSINNAINSLEPEGATNMKAGLENAVNEFRRENDDGDKFRNYNLYTVFMTDGVPESSDCRYRNPTGPYRYYLTNERDICYLTGTTTEPTMFTHKWSPITPANSLKALGSKIFSINMFQQSSDPNEADKNNKAQALMQAVASDPDSTYYVSSPTTKNLTTTYQEIARKICPSS